MKRPWSDEKSDSGLKDEPLLTTEQLAHYISVSVSTLTKWRVAGKGPKHVRLGSRVLYRPVDVDAWLESRLVKSTSQTIPF